MLSVVPDSPATIDVPTPNPWRVPIIPFTVWLLVQLGCLTVSLQDVSLAAQVRPGEAMAVEVLLAGQVGAAALLAPALLRMWPAALLTMATAWPPLLLAGAAQSNPVLHTAAAGVAVSLWIATLAAWTIAGRTDRHRHFVSATATLLAVGGVIVTYLAIEFGGDPSVDFSVPAVLRFTPLTVVWNLANGESAWVSLIPVVTALLLGVVLHPRHWHHSIRAG